MVKKKKSVRSEHLTPAPSPRTTSPGSPPSRPPPTQGRCRQIRRPPPTPSRASPARPHFLRSRARSRPPTPIQLHPPCTTPGGSRTRGPASVFTCTRPRLVPWSCVRGQRYRLAVPSLLCIHTLPPLPVGSKFLRAPRVLGRGALGTVFPLFDRRLLLCLGNAPSHRGEDGMLGFSR